MSITKREIVQAAFEEIGIAAYAFDATSEELQSGLRRLDALVESWEGMGLTFGYPLHDTPSESSLSEVCDIPSVAQLALTTSLALRIAPMFGKIVSVDTRGAAASALDSLRNYLFTMPSMQLPATLPVGAGNQRAPYSATYFQPSDDLEGAGDVISV